VVRVSRDARYAAMAEMTVRLQPGENRSGAATIELTYGGFVICRDIIPPQAAEWTTAVGGLADWMDETALALRAWTDDGQPLDVDATCVLGERMSTGAERWAATAWPGFKGRHPRRHGRPALMAETTTTGPPVYLSASDLIASFRTRAT
jgi:hypothetical protein